MSAGKAFFDTNILLYMYGADIAKRSRAREIFRDHAQTSRIVLSTQVVQEFYAAGSRKLGMSRRELHDATDALLELPLVVVNQSHIRSALRAEEQYKISFWDSLIVAAAESSNADILYTEDLNDGQHYGSVRARNPFL